MSTRSFIGIKQADGSIKAMFKHWDGYPSYMTPFLDKYKSDELAEELVHFDAVECLLSAEQKAEYQASYPDQYPEEKFTKLSTGDYLFYGDGTPQIYKDINDMWGDSWAEYAYLWNGYKWETIPRS